MTNAIEHLPFNLRAREFGVDEFLRSAPSMDTMQINITKRCNLACKHCHVVASPQRTEEAPHEVLQACLDVFEAGEFTTLDITGGAPEMHAEYRWLVDEATRIAQAKTPYATVISRTNAAILTEPGFEDLPQFWAERGVELAASLPHYEERNTNRQRGEGVFAKLIQGLRALNAVGYGCGQVGAAAAGTAGGTAGGTAAAGAGALAANNLTLNIVINPGGAFLPPPQASIEAEYKRELGARYGISFDHLLAITNNPVGRFKSFLEERDALDGYMTRLYNAYNPATLEATMCRAQISVDLDGQLFDCDFNQVIDSPILDQGLGLGAEALDCIAGVPKARLCSDAAGSSAACTGERPADELYAAQRVLTIFDLRSQGLALINGRQVRVGGHCYACTAGAGSSCGGATV